MCAHRHQTGVQAGRTAERFGFNSGVFLTVWSNVIFTVSSLTSGPRGLRSPGWRGAQRPSAGAGPQRMEAACGLGSFTDGISCERVRLWVRKRGYCTSSWKKVAELISQSWASFSSSLQWRWHPFLPTPRLYTRLTEKIFLFRSFYLEQCHSLFAQLIVKGSGTVVFGSLPAVCSRPLVTPAGCSLLLGRAGLTHVVGPGACFKWLFVQSSQQFLKRVHDSPKSVSGWGGTDGPRGSAAGLSTLGLLFHSF